MAASSVRLAHPMHKLGNHADPQMLDAQLQIGGIVAGALFRAAGVFEIVAGDDTQHHSIVPDRAGHGAAGVHRPAAGNDSSVWDTSYGRAHSHDAVDRCGKTDGAAGIRT